MARSERAALAVIVLLVLVGVLIGTGVATFTYAEGTAYLSDRPEACINCHVMRESLEGWQHGPHHAVAVCNDCHVPAGAISKWISKAEHGWAHSKGFTLQDFHEPIRVKDSSRAIIEANCVRCHEPLVAGMAGGPDGQHGTNCTHCHADVGHGPLR